VGYSTLAQIWNAQQKHLGVLLLSTPKCNTAGYCIGPTTKKSTGNIEEKHLILQWSLFFFQSIQRMQARNHPHMDENQQRLWAMPYSNIIVIAWIDFVGNKKPRSRSQPFQTKLLRAKVN
jgi:hypothetical protein